MTLSFLITILFTSCRSMAYFETPNDFRNMPATLYLTNGRSYHGKLQVHTNQYSKSAIRLYTEGDKKPMRFSLADVKAYDFRNDYYELKEVQGGMRLVKEHFFMKRLTKEDSRIHLYENVRKVTRPSGKHTNSYVYYEKEYFLEIPHEKDDGVWALTSSKFVPHFEEKMSKLVADCPTLASKISSKEDGYFYAQVSLINEKRVNVLMNIIDEYNNCEKSVMSN
jgi:hypothetical protein